MARITIAGKRWAAVAKLIGCLTGKGMKIRVLLPNARQAREGYGGGDVEFMGIDIADPFALRVAFQDSDYALLSTGVPEWPSRYDIALVDAAVRAGVPYLVNLSNGGGCRGRSALEWQSETDRYLRDQNIKITLVHPVLLMDDVLTVAADFLSLGQWGGMAGNGRVALIDGRDVAAVAARILLEGPDAHAGKVYRLTGAKAVTMGYIADYLSEYLGRRVVYHRRTCEEQRGVYLRAGLNSARIETLIEQDEFIRSGYYDFSAPDVFELTGRPARSVNGWLREHVAEFPAPFVDA